LAKEIFMIDETVVGNPVLKPAAKPVKKAAKAKKPVAKSKAASKANGKGKTPRGSGVRIRELLAKDWETDKILSTIHKEFPGSKAKACDISWNRGFAARMKKAGGKKAKGKK
jgi:hypothetical protein